MSPRFVDGTGLLEPDSLAGARLEPEPDISVLGLGLGEAFFGPHWTSVGGGVSWGAEVLAGRDGQDSASLGVTITS